jgi:tetratricopeptide (TPR) repeat protein
MGCAPRATLGKATFGPCPLSHPRFRRGLPSRFIPLTFLVQERRPRRNRGKNPHKMHLGSAPLWAERGGEGLGETEVKNLPFLASLIGLLPSLTRIPRTPSILAHGNFLPACRYPVASMTRLSFVFVVLLVGTLSFFLRASFAQHEHPAGDTAKLGKVTFPVSCAPSVQQRFNSAVAMLHSFWYEKANETFTAVAEQDPTCGMAYWGIAMTYYHPLWQPPWSADLKAGNTSVEKAKLVGAKTPREREYIAAVEAFYKDSGKIDHASRALAYERAMEQVQAHNPDDHEAAIFHALALLATAPPTDKTYANQKQAGAILEPLFAEEPEHPGMAHYIIHAYDYPPLAQRALDAARRYAKIAPDSPHALHMPSHIFTRLGLWQESIDSNLASVASAKKNHAPGDELHAKDYLIYAYLQTAQDHEARRALEALPSGRSDDPQYFAWLYAMGTSPARYAVERHDWDQAAALAVPPNRFPGGRWAWTEANLHFARALGLSHTGKTEAARMEVVKLASLRDTLDGINDKYWADQVEMQREGAEAWITFAEGKSDEALRQMRSAADHEDSSDKHAVTPGAILPAREMLGDMLLELKHFAEALVAFESALGTAPNRFNSLSGAARAAKRAGDSEKAKTYYAKLLSICEHADGDRPELKEARTLLVEK